VRYAIIADKQNMISNLKLIKKALGVIKLETLGKRARD